MVKPEFPDVPKMQTLIPLKSQKREGFCIQGDRIFIPRIDVDEQCEGDRIIGPWFISQGSTWLLFLAIVQCISMCR